MVQRRTTSPTQHTTTTTTTTTTPSLPPAPLATKGPTQTTAQRATTNKPPVPMYRHTEKKPLTDMRRTGQAVVPTQPHTTESHIQKKRIQHGTTGKRKVHAGDVYVSNQEGTCTFHNKQMMDQETGLTMIGRQRVGRLNRLEENTTYKDEFTTDDSEAQQEARRARGAPTPQQPPE